VDEADYTVGGLAQANYGARELLSVDGGAAARRRR